jgi:hypothetical protein
MAVSANRLELLQIADAVAREKTIDRRIVIAAMEDAIQKAAKSPLRGRDERARRDRQQDRRDPAAPPVGGRRGPGKALTRRSLWKMRAAVIRPRRWRYHR